MQETNFNCVMFGSEATAGNELIASQAMKVMPSLLGKLGQSGQ